MRLGIDVDIGTLRKVSSNTIVFEEDNSQSKEDIKFGIQDHSLTHKNIDVRQDMRKDMIKDFQAYQKQSSNQNNDQSEKLEIAKITVRMM